MQPSFRPHVLGVDDAPFDKWASRRVPIIGVMMEGHDLVEAVACTDFPVDGDRAAEFLGDWIAGLRCAAALQAVVLGGISIAGLGTVDIDALATRLGSPVVAVNRHDPQNDALIQALQAAGLSDRVAIVQRTPLAWRADEGLFVAHAGTDKDSARRLVLATRHKSHLPEPLRLAHLIGGAISNGQSRGRP